MTPTILRSGPYRFFFYSDERGEPAHIHVRRDASHAKYWLEPISLAMNHGFPAQELNRIGAIVAESQNALLEAWNEFFAGK